MGQRLTTRNETPGRPGGISSPNLDLVFGSIEGFGASIVAIGCARAWLSLQTGIVAAFDTSLSVGSGLNWIQSVALIVASIALSLVKLGPRFAARRKQICLAVGLLGVLIYIAGLYLTPKGTAGAVAVAAASIALFCWMLRLWCEDNCSADLRTVLVRLCLSFVVQYLFYSVVYVVPAPAQQLVAVCSPLFIMGCLSVAPTVPRPRSGVVVGGNGAVGDGATVVSADGGTPVAGTRQTGKTLTPLNVITLGIVIAACCVSHGLLFSFSETVSGVWLLGSLVIAGVALGAAVTLHDRSLFKGFVCIALATQCASVVLTLAFAGNNDWISLSKSMSYAVSMVLTFSIACYLGASRPAPQAGAHAAKWVALYFVAFYSARYLEYSLRPDTFVSLVIVLLCLVVSAVLMLGNDWSALLPGASAEANGDGSAAGEEADQDEGDAEETLRALCERLAREHDLTHRETDVLAMLLHDVPIREIAEKSQVSVNTVRSQVQSIYRKLDVHSREELGELVDADVRGSL